MDRYGERLEGCQFIHRVPFLGKSGHPARRTGESNQISPTTTTSTAAENQISSRSNKPSFPAMSLHISSSSKPFASSRIEKPLDAEQPAGMKPFTRQAEMPRDGNMFGRMQGFVRDVRSTLNPSHGLVYPNPTRSRFYVPAETPVNMAAQPPRVAQDMPFQHPIGPSVPRNSAGQPLGVSYQLGLNGDLITPL
jgi:hypothetical protein